MADWDPVFHWTNQTLEAVLSQTGPGYRLGESIGQGWDAKVYRLHQENSQQPRFLKIASRPLGLQCIGYEASALPQIHSTMGNICPVLHHKIKVPLDSGGATLGIIFAPLPGIDATHHLETIANNRPFASELAERLGQLHQTQIDDLPDDLLQRADTNVRLERVLRLQSQFNSAEQHRAVATLKKWAYTLSQCDTESSPIRTTVHGDLYAKHILLNSDHSLSGIIDWGDVHRGDPALDLSIAYALFHPPVQAVFWQQYRLAGGQLNPTTLLRAKFTALRYSVVLTHYAEATGDGALKNYGQHTRELLDADL